MVSPSESDIRTTIGISDTAVLTSAHITLAIADAVTITGQTDEIALRYYTCYLIAQQWDVINGTASMEGVTFRIPEPEKFLALYKTRIQQILSTAGNSSGMVKTSVNKDFVVDPDDFELRQRESSDPEYY